MGRDTCRMPRCENEPLSDDAPAGVKSNFCSAECDVLYHKRRDEAKEARLDAEREARDEGRHAGASPH
jgi:hypothetical protein